MPKSQNDATNLGTTGAVSQASAGSKSIGTPRSETQSAASALAKLDPRDTDSRITAALGRCSGRSPAFERKGTFPTQVTTAVNWTCSSEDQRREALETVERATLAAPDALIAEALVTLRALTRGRDEHAGIDRETENLIWLRYLKAYPADIACTVLHRWPTQPNGSW